MLFSLVLAKGRVLPHVIAMEGGVCYVPFIEKGNIQIWVQGELLLPNWENVLRLIFFFPAELLVNSFPAIVALPLSSEVSCT